MADVLKQAGLLQEVNEALKSSLPALAKIAQKTEFDVTISSNKDGFRLSCYIGAPLDPDGEAPAEPIQIETIEIPTYDIENGLSIEETDREIIKKALMATNGNRKAAAAKLGISECTLRSKIKKYRIYQRDIEIEKDKERIQQALEECGGDSALAAKKLGLTTKAIRRRITVYGL